MPSNRLVLTAPDGTQIDLAERVEAEAEPGFLSGETASIRQFYDDQGYVLVRNLIPKERCEAARQAFDQEVKPYKGVLYRQPSSGTAERHKFSENGYMLNSILNIQDLEDSKFPEFKKVGLSIVACSEMDQVVRTLLNEDSTVVQTMYFEGNPETWPHQDSYYLDSTEIGRMVAAWIAVEDIDAGSGRFFVYPKSHKIDMSKHSSDTNIAINHDKYKRLVIDAIHDNNLRCLAPAMQAGDVLFWNSKTIHGSLRTVRPDRSRCSFTAHFVPSSTGLLQFQQRTMKLNLKNVGPFKVHCPKDQNVLKNKMVLALEENFPGPFYFLKKQAIKLLVR